MKSIQSKIILLILVGIVVSATIIGGAGILRFKQAIDDDSVKIMNLTCSEQAQELNNVLGRIEQSVEIMSVYAIENLDSIDRLSKDSAYLREYINKLDELSLTIANETAGAVSIYVRLNPEIASAKEGVFKVKNEEDGMFENFELTDLSQYSADDMEHVGWYYVPVNAEKAVWMPPYRNDNIDVYMISYVIPIYKYSELVGIVGMDIDFHYITDKVDDIQIYETGEAFLTNDDFAIVHSKSYPQGALVREFSESFASAEKAAMTSKNALYSYTSNGIKKKVAFETIGNGMCLAVTAPISEINGTRNRLIVQSLVMAFGIVVVFVVSAMVIAKTIVKPLKELNKAAKEIADGNLEVSLDCKLNDEVGTLSKSLSEMVNQLKIRIDCINDLAYMDMLTGIKNNTAYSQQVSQIKANIQKGETDFSVFIIDINGLKDVNDNYGHDYGNELIVTASKIIVGAFGYEHVYRIGGDEFGVLLENVSAHKCVELEREFESRVKNYTGKLKLSAAIGSAVYDKDYDSGYDSVFKRADEKMYKQKQKMKSRGETSTVEGL